MGNKNSSQSSKTIIVSQPTIVTDHINIDKEPEVPEIPIADQFKEEILKYPDREYYFSQNIVHDTHGAVSGIAIDNITGALYFASDDQYLKKAHGYNHMKHIQLAQYKEIDGIVWDGKDTIYYNGRGIGAFRVNSGKDDGIAGQDNLFFYGLLGITMDRTTGDLFVSDQNRIFKVSSSTGSIEQIGGSSWGSGALFKHQDGPAEQSLFSRPHGLAFRDGVVYVADFGNHCIRQIKDGIVSTIAGIPTNFGQDDGPLSQATFLLPRDICFDRNGDILVCEDHQVRRVDLKQKYVSTIHFFPRILQKLRCLCIDARGNLFLGGRSSVYRADRTTWRLERFLWIGHLKEEAEYCLLAKLPSDIIKEIALHL